SMQVLQTPFTF
nr:immunoglobulin light chain junction region [Macaca mulatta]